MGSCDKFDGLCGIIAPFASSDLQIRCKYEMAHSGPCSWEKYKSRFFITAGCGSYESYYLNREINGVKQGFVEAVIHSPLTEKIKHPVIVSSKGKTKKKE